MTVLTHEREPQELGNASRYTKTVKQLTALVACRPGRRSRGEQHRELAWAIIEADMLQHLVSRRLSDRLDGIQHGPEGSIDKLLNTWVEQAVGHAAVDIAGCAPRWRRPGDAQHLPLQPGPERHGWDRPDPEEPRRLPDPRSADVLTGSECRVSERSPCPPTAFREQGPGNQVIRVLMVGLPRVRGPGRRP